VDTIREFILELNNDAHLLPPDTDSALLGVAQRWGRPQVPCYDYEACVKILTDRGMSRVQADEHMMFDLMRNVLLHEDQQPVFITRLWGRTP